MNYINKFHKNVLAITKFSNPNICKSFDADVISFSIGKAYKIKDNVKEPLPIEITHLCRYSKIRYSDKVIRVGHKAIVKHTNGIIVFDLDTDKVFIL